MFSNDGSCRIARDLSISTGAGEDVMSIGTATVTTGGQSDHAAIDGMNVRGVLMVGLGAGDDGVEIRNTRALV